MKQFIIVMVSIVVLAGFICGWVPASRGDDQQQIAELERKYIVTTDPDEIMKYWSSGDDVVLFDVITPREFAGYKAIRDDLAAASSGNKDIKVDFLELQVISDGKLALARSVQHYTAKDRNGKPVDATFRLTHIWRKTNGQWKIIHSHASYPVDMKTGKADMASKM